MRLVRLPDRVELATGHQPRPIRAADVDIDPLGDDSAPDSDAITSSWVVHALVGGALDTALAEFAPRWLADTWGFTSVVVDP